MSTSNQVNSVTLVADDAAPIYRILTLDGTTGLPRLAADPAELPCGVSGETAVAGEAFNMVLPAGIMKIEAGAAVTLGSALMTDSTGRAIDLVGGASEYIVGTALDAAGAAGDIIRVLIQVHQDVA